MKTSNTCSNRVPPPIVCLLLASLMIASCAMLEDSNRECIDWEIDTKTTSTCIAENEHGDCIEYANDSETQETCLDSVCKEGFYEDSEGDCVAGSL